jgi:predicted nucleotidyltransferase component of viral defense system
MDDSRATTWVNHLIEKDEIDLKSAELGVHAANVQRDYVFGWLLRGIFQTENPLSQLLVLKGGNAFRKAYFEHARFSNDLDFSTQLQLDSELLLNGLKIACARAAEGSGVEFLVDDSRVSTRTLVDGETQIYEARIYFKSFYGEEDVRIRVDLDMKEYDRIFLPIQNRELIHSYSDSSLCQHDIRCLKLEELLALKLKALLGRLHSPDLYDFVHAVFFQKTLNISRREVILTFLKQTIYEPEPMSARSLLLEFPFQAIKVAWNEFIVCPRASVFTFDDAEAWFKTVITEMFSMLAPSPVLSPAYAALRGRGGLDYFSSGPRSQILEAARLQRVIRFMYDGLERMVEPYALVFKRRLDGGAREYFYGWDLIGGRSGQKRIKLYIASKVGAIQITEQSFRPRFPVGLVKDGRYFSRPFSSGTRRTISRPSTMEYTVACPYCGKRFKRSRYDTSLNEHKDRFGHRCYGRVGHIV